MLSGNLIKIDLTVFPLEENQSKIVAAFIQINDLSFIEKSKIYDFQGMAIQFQQNLLQSNKEGENPKKYYVISNSSYGLGSFNRVRPIEASVEFYDGKFIHKKEKDLAVRIGNPKTTQKTRQQTGNEFKLEDSIQEYENAKPFTHYGMQKPIAVLKKYPKSSKKEDLNDVKQPFLKTYAIVNKLPGTSCLEASEFMTLAQPDTEAAIKMVILPILTAYKEQISDKGYVHTDISENNVKSTLLDVELNEKPKINFLDFDKAKRIGSPDSNFGTPGYIPPEYVLQNNLEAKTSRDIFALGFLLMNALNPDLLALTENMDKTEANGYFFQLVMKQGYYDPEAMCKSISQELSFFYYFSVDDATEQERTEILDLLKAMTSRDPEQRPSIEYLITTFQNLAMTLESQRCESLGDLTGLSDIDRSSSLDSLSSNECSSSFGSTTNILQNLVDDDVHHTLEAPQPESLSEKETTQNKLSNKEANKQNDSLIEKCQDEKKSTPKSKRL